MRNAKKLILFLLCAVMSFSFAGCGNKGSNDFTIGFYLGGYGKEWAEALGAKFEEETGIVVNYAPDAAILTKIETKLRNGSSEDIFFSHQIAWERFAALGYLEPLNDLYETADTDGTKFKDRIIDIAVDAAKLSNTYYKVPWTQGVGGIVYNVKMFEQNDWTVPTTYEELQSLCARIVADNVSVPNSDRKVTPFVWAGLDSWTWDYPVFEWWAQLAGTDKIKELMQYGSAETFNPDTNWKEMKDAFTAWYNLIALNPSYSVEGSNGLSKLTSQMSFLAGQAAMIPEGHWFYHEIKERAPVGFEMAFMNTPKLSNAKEGYEKVNYLVGFGDSAVIPKKAKNKEAAKKFLQFMSREDNCRLFTELTDGTPLAYKYSLEGIAEDNKFIESIADKLKTSINFNDYSSNQMAILLHETLMVWPENEYFYVNAFNDSSKYSPKAIFDDIFQRTSDNWQLWKNSAGL